MNIKTRFTWLLAAAVMILMIGAGCASSQPDQDAESNAKTNAAEAVREASWENIAQGISTRSVSVSTSTDAAITLYRFDPAQVSFRFAHATSAKRVSAWLKDEDADAVINGVYFNEDHSPSGFLRSNGKTVSNRKFDPDKSGLIRLDGSPRIVNTATEPFDPASALEAAQSYPFLITHGEPALTRDTGLTARRSFIGTDADGLVYLGVLDGASISLFELMRLLLDQPVRWNDALNLDGGPSTGIAADIGSHERFIDSYVGVPNVIVVER